MNKITTTLTALLLAVGGLSAQLGTNIPQGQFETHTRTILTPVISEHQEKVLYQLEEIVLQAEYVYEIEYFISDGEVMPVSQLFTNNVDTYMIENFAETIPPNQQSWVSYKVKGEELLRQVIITL